MPAKTPTAATEPVASLKYEAVLDELDALVSRLESGQMPLDELLGGYRRGIELLTHCRERLQAVEDQIKVVDASGAAKAWTPR